MTLKERLEKEATYGWIGADKCEEVADDYAIGFGQWLIKKEHEYTNKIIAMEELLEIYKQEKGL